MATILCAVGASRFSGVHPASSVSDARMFGAAAPFVRQVIATVPNPPGCAGGIPMVFGFQPLLSGCSGAPLTGGGSALKRAGGSRSPRVGPTRQGRNRFAPAVTTTPQGVVVAASEPSRCLGLARLLGVQA